MNETDTLCVSNFNSVPKIPSGLGENDVVLDCKDGLSVNAAYNRGEDQ